MGRATLHDTAVVAGMALADYERYTLGASLILEPAEAPPTWSRICTPREDASTVENAVRLALAVGSVTWVACHLLRPWVRRLFKRGWHNTHPLP